MASIRKTLALALVGTVLAGPAAAAERILFNCFFPPQHHFCKVFVGELKKRVETATEGRVKIDIPPSSLAAPPDQYDAIVGGVMDGGIAFNAFLAGQAPGTQFGLLPFASGNFAASNSAAHWDVYQKHFADKNEFGDAVLVGIMASTGSEMMSLTDTPIKNMDDIRNRKMWGLPGTVANTLKASGSSVVSGPAVQMLEIVSKGVVDGYAGVDWSALIDFKIGTYTKSVTETEGKLFTPTFSFMISRAKWDKISAADQAAMQATLGKDYSRFMGAYQDQVEVDARAAMIKAGVVAVTPDASLERDMRSIGQGQVDAWIAKVSASGVDGQAVLDDYTAAIKAEKAN